MNNLKYFLLNGYQEYNHLMKGGMTQSLIVIQINKKKKEYLEIINKLEIQKDYKLIIMILILVIPILNKYEKDVNYNDIYLFIENQVLNGLVREILRAIEYNNMSAF